MTRYLGTSLISMAFIAALTAVAATPAGATLARQRALGDGAAYVEDDANVLVWFASLVDYPDQLVLDFGHLDHDARGFRGSGGGLHAQLDRAGRWGTAGLYVQERLPAGAPGGAVSLLGARAFGRLALGAKAMFSSHFEGSNATGSYGHGEGLYLHSFGLAARWDVRPGLYGDLAGEVVNVQYDGSEQDLWSLPYQQTWSTWGARARCFVGLNQSAALVPVLDHRRDERPAYAAVLAAPADLAARRTAAGLGLNLLPDADNLVIISGEYCWGHERHDRLAGMSWVYEYDRAAVEYNEIHARVGFESRVLPWLSLRGALQYWRLQHELVAERESVLGAEADRWFADRSIRVLAPVTLGVGLHAGALQADVVFNARWTETYGAFPFGPQAGQRGTYTGVVLGYRF